MFDRISKRYDLLNHLLSFGQDFLWRKKVAILMKELPHSTVLDLACGTCDLILIALKHNSDIELGMGVDLSGKMLSIGQRKVRSKSLSNQIALVKGDGMSLPIAAGIFDFAMISFGIRNMPEPDRALAELYRALKPGGSLAVLEFSIPSNGIIRSVYLFYFRRLLPWIGGLISGDRGAYTYLNKTVETFYTQESFCSMMTKAGFSDVRTVRLSFGVAAIYLGLKR
jgi:demethylmenaquinone methyltransferase/2-methoxy-6-polyprenyl-1,4-benzoquinol methylase